MSPKIEFYRTRNFSEKLNATFQFIRENWKPVMKFSIYLLLPVCLVQTLAMNSVFSDLFRMGMTNNLSVFGSGFYMNYGLVGLCALIGSVLLSALVFSLMQTYERREQRLVNVQWHDFRDQLVRNVKRSLLLLVVMIMLSVLIAVVIGIVSGALAALLPSAGIVVFVFLFLIICVGLLALIPFLSLLFPVFILEPEIGIAEAMGKAWKFGFSDFWSLLGFVIVICIIASVLQSMVTLPWYIVTVVGSLLSVDSDVAATQSIVYKLSVFILGIVQTMGNYIATMIMMVGLGFQYFHSREKNEGVTIDSHITHFNQLQ